MSDTNKNYITISDFAKLAGVARQSVYSRIDKDLSVFCQVVDKRKMIDISALSLYQRKEDCQEYCQDNCHKTVSVSVDLTSYLTEENERLRQEIVAKDVLIAEKDRQIASYADKFIALSEKQTELIQREQEISARALQTTGQAQLLHVNTQEDKTQQEKEQELMPDDKLKKRSIFSRLFS